MNKLKSERKIQVFEIQTLKRMVIPLSQQYEEKENNRVINPSYVKIYKNSYLAGL